MASRLGQEVIEMTRNIDYGNPRMRASELTEGAYINALMTEGHQAFNEELMTAETSHQLTITLNVDHRLFSISDDYGTTQDPTSQMPDFLSRMDDLQSVVFDSLFSRFRAQNLYGELTVIFRSGDNYTSREVSRDTF